MARRRPPRLVNRAAPAEAAVTRVPALPALVPVVPAAAVTPALPDLAAPDPAPDLVLVLVVLVTKVPALADPVVPATMAPAARAITPAAPAARAITPAAPAALVTVAPADPRIVAPAARAITPVAPATVAPATTPVDPAITAPADPAFGRGTPSIGVGTPIAAISPTPLGATDPHPGAGARHRVPPLTGRSRGPADRGCTARSTTGATT